MNFIFLVTFLVFLNFTNAGLTREFEPSPHYSPPRDENVVVSQGNYIYIQMPGEGVIFGQLNYFAHDVFPIWVHSPTALPPHSYAFVQRPDGLGLRARLRHFRDADNPNFQGFHCYIRKENINDIIIFGAPLQNNNEALEYPEITRVFVRIWGENNPSFSGLVHRIDGYTPVWFPR